jgi:DNA-binding SARP family transcriptional activator/tetratricopeptide (TPR) repeat protein
VDIWHRTSSRSTLLDAARPVPARLALAGGTVVAYQDHVPTVELHLVGRFLVLVDDRELAPREVGTRKARLLLARLAAARGETLSVDTLADAVWGSEQPHGPAENLATLVSRLRSALGAGVVEGDRTGWRLGAAVEVDLAAAAALVARADDAASRDEPAVAAAAALAAVRRLDGDLLVEEPDAGWADPVRHEAAALLRRARHRAADACRRTADPGTAAAAAADAVRADPYDEVAVRLLMRAHRAAGEPARALAVYEDLRRVLADELGADPAPQTRALHQQVLTEPGLGGDDGEGDDRAQGQRRPGPSRREPLVGREEECAWLSARWGEAVAGRPGLVLVTGEPGIGKTRLVDEVADLAGRTGGTVLAARCYETERSLFLQPLVDALRPQLLRSSPAALRELAGDRAAPLALLFPELADVLAPAAPSPPERRSAEVERGLAYQALATVLRRLAARSPVLLALDDLHHAGLATLEQLHLLSRTSGVERLLVAATLRTHEGADAVRRLAPVAEQVALGPLGPRAVAELAAAAGHAELGDSLAQRTRGHALFVVESLHALGAGEQGVPASLTAAVLARVARLDPAAAELVRAACVLGASFEPATLAELLSVPMAVAVRGSGQLVEAGLVVEAGRSYEFANDLVQEVLYATTPEPTRHAYHRLAADLFQDRPEARALHAAASEQPARAALAWLAAAASAGNRFAAADAERLLTRALDAAGQAGANELVTQALLHRARQRESLGRYTEAVSDLAVALELSRAHGFTQLEMLVHRELAGDAPIALGRPMGSCIPHLQAGLDLARRLGDDAVAADLLGRLAVLTSNRLDFVAAREYGLAAVAAGRASGDPAALRRGLDGLKTSCAYVGDFAALAEVTAELEPLARRSGDLFLLQWLVFEQSFIPLAAGDWDRAAALVEEATALNRRSGRVKYEGWFLAHLGWIARLAGHTGDAVGHGRRAVAAVPPDGHSWFGATASSMLACTLLSTGEEAGRREAVRLLRHGLAAADRSGAEGYRLRCLAPLAEATGSHDALAQADRMLAAARVPDGFAWLHGVDVYLALGRGWLAAGRPQPAADVLELLVGPGRRQGWTPLLTAAGADQLLAESLRAAGPGPTSRARAPARHNSAASRPATRSAPSPGTST